MLREIRNEFSHDYPDDTKLQAETLNKGMVLAKDLLDSLVIIEQFTEPYRLINTKELK